MVYVTVMKLNMFSGERFAAYHKCMIINYSHHYFSRKQSTSWVLFPLKHISRCKLFSGQAETITHWESDPMQDHPVHGNYQIA